MVPSLNTTSTADISFMLLTFFLVTSSMDVDHGLVRQLPPIDNSQDDAEATEVSRDNTLSFRVVPGGGVTLNGKTVELGGLRRRIARFLAPRAASHVIYIDSDPNSSFDTYFALEDEIVAAYNTVRDNIARQRYHRAYAECSDSQKAAVRELCPQHIAETYNTTLGGADSEGGTGGAEGAEGGGL